MCPFLESQAKPPPVLSASADALQRTILATVPDAMIVIDEAGTILLFSEAAHKMFGYDEAEVVGQNVR
ncbi:MAG: hypothetical protein RIS17_139, partial [Pseudomonadota bacterium]